MARTRSWILDPRQCSASSSDKVVRYLRLMPEINNNYFIIKRPRLAAGSKYTSTRRNTSSQPDTARFSSFVRRGTGIDQARLLAGDAPRSRKEPSLSLSLLRRSRGINSNCSRFEMEDLETRKKKTRWKNLAERNRQMRFVNSCGSRIASIRRMLGFLSP